MPFISTKELKTLKLSSIPLKKLREYCVRLGYDKTGTASELIKKLVNVASVDATLDNFIKEEYMVKIQERRNLIDDEALKAELQKVREFSWGVVQGQLDQKVQAEYVRKFVRYDELVSNVQARLHKEITDYVVCTWYNHWTTVLTEEHVSQHPKIVPTLKNIFGIDIFFDGQPFDLKTTYLPKDYDVNDVLANPQKLAIWMYENQGAQRFSASNRLFVVLLDQENPEESWRLKRDFNLVFVKIDEFFNREKVKSDDEVVFTFKHKTYTAITKVLLITK